MELSLRQETFRNFDQYRKTPITRQPHTQSGNLISRMEPYREVFRANELNKLPTIYTGKSLHDICWNVSRTDPILNIEHIIPQSWFPPYSNATNEISNLFPEFRSVNMLRGNLTFGLDLDLNANDVPICFFDCTDDAHQCFVRIFLNAQYQDRSTILGTSKYQSQLYMLHNTIKELLDELRPPNNNTSFEFVYFDTCSIQQDNQIEIQTTVTETNTQAKVVVLKLDSMSYIKYNDNTGLQFVAIRAHRRYIASCFYYILAVYIDPLIPDLLMNKLLVTERHVFSSYFKTVNDMPMLCDIMRRHTHIKSQIYTTFPILENFFLLEVDISEINAFFFPRINDRTDGILNKKLSGFVNCNNTIISQLLETARRTDAFNTDADIIKTAEKLNQMLDNCRSVLSSNQKTTITKFFKRNTTVHEKSRRKSSGKPSRKSSGKPSRKSSRKTSRKTSIKSSMHSSRQTSMQSTHSTQNDASWRRNAQSTQNDANSPRWHRNAQSTQNGANSPSWRRNTGRVATPVATRPVTLREKK